jgi:pyruvate dehydrogenase E2 component (dihydrolipoamide acetyltransferase)
VQAAPQAEPASRGGRVRATPVARRLATEQNVDLTAISGTGPDGRIVLRDVEAAIAGGPPKAGPAAGTTSTIEMSKMRQTIARRMAQSKREAPHYYITVDIDMTEAERLRRQLNEAVEEYPRVSVNDMIVRASAISLARHPMFNSWFVDEQVQQHADINVCIAIALEDGLIAPAILDTANKNLGEIADASRSLGQRAKSGSLKANEYTAGTFTVSNLGMFDVETLVAIIQPPQTAILGVGAVREVPVAVDGNIGTADLMKAALSGDHRVTDGAQGAQFLNEIRGLLESPAALLV